MEPFCTLHHPGTSQNCYVQFSASASSNPLTDNSIPEDAQYQKDCFEMILHGTTMREALMRDSHLLQPNDFEA